MVPGYVQGLSGVPPDHPEGGAGGELYSEGLWWTQNIQHPTSNGPAKPPKTTPGRMQSEWRMKNGGAKPRKATQSHIKATPKRVDSQGVGTPKPP
jgi:hypothetical protein